MGILRHARHELFCQGVAKGLTKTEAYARAGYKATSASAPRTLSHRPEVKERISELLKASARRVEFSRKEVLDRIVDDWELSRKLGQMSSALKAAELYGRDVHKMFVERKEVGTPGDFDNKSEAELRDIILNDMKELGWDETAIIPPDKSLN